MVKFTGSECIGCNEKIKETDDIVVCPECGTPYHRECYTKHGSCINTKLHEENISWAEENEYIKAKNNAKKCPFCKHDNQPHALVCEECGASLTNALLVNDLDDIIKERNEEIRRNNPNGFIFNPLDKYCGMNKDEVLDGDVKISEAADFIKVNVPHYLMMFKKIKDTGKKITVNAISILFPQFYFAYRKMFGAAILTTLLTSLLSLPTLMVYLKGMLSTLIEIGYSADFLKSFNVESAWFQIISGFASYASLAVSILAFLFANYLYYKHMQRKIKYVKSKYTSQNEISRKIAQKGGTSILYVLLTFGVQFILSFVMFYVLISM